jgi:hypothetical protein
MPPRQQAKRANKVIEITALNGEPFWFPYTGGALDGDKVDIEYTEVACKHLLGCTACTDGTSALDLAHLTIILPGRAAMLHEGTEKPMVRYTAEANGKLYIRAEREASGSSAKWTLKLHAEMKQATEP